VRQRKKIGIHDHIFGFIWAVLVLQTRPWKPRLLTLNLQRTITFRVTARLRICSTPNFRFGRCLVATDARVAVGIDTASTRRHFSTGRRPPRSLQHLRAVSGFCNLHIQFVKPKALHGMPITRVNQSVQGVLQRPTLAWRAQHMPPGVKPNCLTFVWFCWAMLVFFGNFLVLAFDALDVGPMVPYLSRFGWVSVHGVIILAPSGN